jgi:ubiquinone biosynthesis protein
MFEGSSKIDYSRLREIVRILVKYRCYRLISKLELVKHLPFHQRFLPESQEDSFNPRTLRLILEELGGAFIKLGQLLALRPDMIGVKYAKELEKLFLDVEAEDFDHIKKKLSSLPLDSIEKTPLGSASIAQVYRGKIKGKTVAIKIKRTGIEEVFRKDITLMYWFAKQVKKHYNLSFVDPLELISEFEKYTKKELSLKQEASNIKRFGTHFSGDPLIKIPKVYDEYSTDSLLVMEFVEGHSIYKMKKKDKTIIPKITEAVYKMLFEFRFFHADLHPGNIFFHKEKIIFLDFGIVGSLDSELEGKLFQLFSSLVNGDLEGTSLALIELHIGKNEVDERVLREGISSVLGPYYNTSLKKMNFEEIFYGGIEVARSSGIKLPAQIVLFGKSLVTLEGFCRELDPNFNVVQNAKPYVNKLIKERLSAKALLSEGKKQGYAFYQEAVKLPKTMRQVTRQFRVMEEQITGIDEHFGSLLDIFKLTGGLLTLAILFATIFIAGVLLVDLEPKYGGVSFFSCFLFGISAFLFFTILRYLKRELKM